MFNKVKITFKLHIPNFTQFSNFKVLEQVFLYFNRRFKYSLFTVSKKLGSNTGVLLKESPFHYPIAKKLLSQSNREVVLESTFVVKGSCSIHNRLDFKLIDVITANTELNTNSLFTNKSTGLVIYLNYKPTYN